MYVTSISGNVEHDVVQAYATAADFLWGIWAIHAARRRLIVGRFDHEGLHQLQNSFVVKTSYYQPPLLLRELLKYLRESWV